MNRFSRWLGLGCTLACLAVMASCTGDADTVEPTVDGLATRSPLISEQVAGSCMGDDAVNYPGNVSGFGTDPTVFNCTANDIRIANARTAGGDPIQCVEGEPLSADIVADIIQTASSARSDIGVWVAEDGGDAETGTCGHYYFPPPFTYPPVGSFDAGDDCGDIASADTVEAFPLGGLNLTCSDPDGDGLLEVGSCVSWTQPGGDRTCPAASGGARAGTLPANKSKCNCDPFFIAIEILPELTLEKVVVNDDGGDLGSTDWTLTATGPETIEGIQGDAAITDAGVELGTYTLSENALPGYAQDGDWVCMDNDTGGSFPVSGGNQVTLASGNKVTCTVTNNDIRPQLTVIKHVITDDGGTAVAGDFTMQVTATNPDDDSFPGAESPGTTIGVDAGAYSVDEADFPEYSKSLSADCSGTIALGETKTCTITNDDQPAGLIVIKHVITDDGGTAVASDFTMQVTATNPSLASFPGAESPGTNVTVDPGAYSVDEVAFPGYSKSLSADCSGTIALGETKTCTITNDDDTPHLTLEKVVSGGDALDTDFTLTATGPVTISGVEGAAEVTNKAVKVGTYTLSESSSTGYVQVGDWSCVGGTFTAPDQIAFALGESATCTVTNQALARISLEKLVAGAASTMTWNFTLEGPGVSEDVNFTSFTDFNGVYLQVGEEYTICEIGLAAGWSASWTMDGNPVNPYNPNATDNPPEDLGNRCHDFTPTAAGATLQFVVDNLPPPGGEPRTIGYWKNWSTCTSGGQVRNAERNGGAAAGFFLLDDVLPLEITADPEALVDGFWVSTCEEGVSILDKRSTDDEKKRANDAAYGMAAQLLAAMANTSPVVNAACRPSDLAGWITDARELLFTIGFDGTGSYLPPQTDQKELRADALDLATWLDNYNNGMYCGG